MSIYHISTHLHMCTHLSIYLSIYLSIDPLPRRPNHGLTHSRFPVSCLFDTVFRSKNWSWGFSGRFLPLWATLGVVLGRSWVILRRSWAILGRSWTLLGAPGGLLGRPGKLLGRPGAVPNRAKNRSENRSQNRAGSETAKIAQTLRLPMFQSSR